MCEPQDRDSKGRGVHREIRIGICQSRARICGAGGVSNSGTVFKVTRKGVETVLYSFARNPMAQILWPVWRSDTARSSNWLRRPPAGSLDKIFSPTKLPVSPFISLLWRVVRRNAEEGEESPFR
jgi:hypothetical protein